MLDPVVLPLLVLFVGLPLLSLIVLVAFTATADFEPEGVEVRGGSVRGAIAAAVAKILVGDAKTFQLPLVVTLRKVGILGTATPLFGGATVRDIEWRIYVEGEHVSTVTEASSVNVRSADRVLRLPVNAEVHLPRGLVGTWRQYRQGRRSGREVLVEVRGHVIVKHWLMSREMPVRVTRHVVLGTPQPRLEVRFEPQGPEPANAASLLLRLSNPYREEVLDGPLRLVLAQDRRLRRDPALAAHEETLRIQPGATVTRRFRVRLFPSVRDAAGPDDVAAQSIYPRLWWDGDGLEASGAEAEDEIPPVALRASRGAPLTAALEPDPVPADPAPQGFR